MIEQNTRYHGFSYRYGSYAYTWIVTPFSDYCGSFTSSTWPPRNTFTPTEISTALGPIVDGRTHASCSHSTVHLPCRSISSVSLFLHVHASRGIATNVRLPATVGVMQPRGAALLQTHGIVGAQLRDEEVAPAVKLPDRQVCC